MRFSVSPKSIGNHWDVVQCVILLSVGLVAPTFTWAQQPAAALTYHPQVGQEFLYRVKMEFDGKNSNIRANARFQWQLSYQIAEVEADQWLAHYKLENRTAHGSSSPAPGPKSAQLPSQEPRASWDLSASECSQLYPSLSKLVSGTLVVSTDGTVISNSADTCLPGRFAQVAELPIASFAGASGNSWVIPKRISAVAGVDSPAGRPRELNYQISMLPTNPVSPTGPNETRVFVSITQARRDELSRQGLTPLQRSLRGVDNQSINEWYFTGTLTFNTKIGMPSAFTGGGEFSNDDVMVPGLEKGKLENLTFARIALYYEAIDDTLRDETPLEEQHRKINEAQLDPSRLLVLKKNYRDVLLMQLKRNRELFISGLRMLKSCQPAWADRELVAALRKINSDQTQEVFDHWKEVGRIARSKPRLWKSATGSFSVRATLVKTEANEVTLQRVDTQQEIVVPIERLSQADRQFATAFGQID